MLIIADTSALITLATCNGLRWLDNLFEKIQVPQAVYNEAIKQGKPQAKRLSDYLADKIMPINLDALLSSHQN